MYDTPLWLTFRSLSDPTASALGRHYLGWNPDEHGVRRNLDEELLFDPHLQKLVEPITNLYQLEERILQAREWKDKYDAEHGPVNAPPSMLAKYSLMSAGVPRGPSLEEWHEAHPGWDSDHPQWIAPHAEWIAMHRGSAKAKDMLQRSTLALGTRGSTLDLDPPISRQHTAEVQRAKQLEDGTYGGGMNTPPKVRTPLFATSQHDVSTAATGGNKNRIFNVESRSYLRRPPEAADDVTPFNPFMSERQHRPIGKLNLQHFNRWKSLYPDGFTGHKWKALWEPAICPLTVQRLKTTNWTLAEPQRRVLIERESSMLSSHQQLLMEMVYQRMLAGYQIGEATDNIDNITADAVKKNSDTKLSQLESNKSSKSANLTAYLKHIRAQKDAARKPNARVSAPSVRFSYATKRRPRVTMSRQPVTATYSKIENTKAKPLQQCTYKLQNGEEVHELEFDPHTDRVSVKVWSPVCSSSQARASGDEQVSTHPWQSSHACKST